MPRFWTAFGGKILILLEYINDNKQGKKFSYLGEMRMSKGWEQHALELTCFIFNEKVLFHLLKRLQTP